MKTKMSLLRELALQNDWESAIKLVAKFPRLGKERDDILSADMALKHPSFCIAIKKDPEQLIKLGVQAIKSKYNLN